MDYDLDAGPPNVFVRGLHKLYTTVRGPDILRNMIVSGYVTFCQINKLFVNILFFHLTKCFAGWIWPTGLSLETPDLQSGGSNFELLVIQNFAI